MKILAWVIVFLLSCLILTATLIAEEIAGIEITSFKYGIIQKDSEGINQLFKETDTIPYNEDFGWQIEYSSKKDVIYYCKLYTPAKPAVVAKGNITIDDTTYKSPEYIFERGNKTYTFKWGLDPGDPSGKYIEEIYIGGQLYKTITFNILQP